MNFEFDENHNLVRFSFPRYLFRFARPDYHLLSSLRDSYLWFSSPTALNDPFDCRDIWELNNTQDELRQYLRRYSAKYVPDDQFESFFQLAVSQPETLRRGFQELHRLKIEQISVCCFSALNDNNLMWSHYADGHRGACLVFDTLRLIGLPVARFSVVDVTYSDTSPRWNQIRERLTYGDSARYNLRFDSTVLGTKTLDWAYEQEIRLISHTPGANHFGPEALVGFIRGLRMSNSHRRDLESEITARYPQCEIKDATILDRATTRAAVDGFENEIRSLNVIGWRRLP